MAKGIRRQNSIAAKNERKRTAMTAAPGKRKHKSAYAKKHAEQARGHYRPTSPFYLP